ncbi:MAG TPA: ABC-2 family transporter protein [Acidimicrobiales bacterium]|nr:ABC-2 family transporter protein [Acidimicrobiales bacterium]
MRTYVWLAVLAAGADAGGLTRSDVVTYAFVTGGLSAALQPTWATEIVERIRSGDIVTDLYRPVDFQLWWLARDAGSSAYRLLTRAIPPLFIGGLVFDLALPTRAAVWLSFAVSVSLAFVLVYAWKLLVSLSGFWLLNPAGVVQLAAGLFTFGSGSLLPLAFMPDGLEGVLRWLPFAAMLQLPLEVLLGVGTVEPLARQLVWAVVLLAAGRIVLRRAERKLVVQGG